MATGGSTLHGVTDDQKRWLVFGIVLSKVLVPEIRPFVEQEVQNEYRNLQTSHSIHIQSTSGRLKNWRTFLKYENINGNDALPRLPGGRFDYSLFDCCVASHVDFARLYVENHMAKFTAFDEHCDASAVLTLLGKVPVFSPAVQGASNDVRQARNAWAHCVFSDWDPVNYQQTFNKMETLVKALRLPPANERNLIGELKDWELKGCILCMNATVDPDLLKLVQQHVDTMETDVEQLTFEVQEDKERVSQVLKDISTSLAELEARIASVEREQEDMKQKQSSLSKTVNFQQSEVDSRTVRVEREQEVMKQEQSLLSDKMDSLCSDVEDVQQRVALVEDKLSSSTLQESRGNGSCSYGESANDMSQQDLSNVSVEIASCEGDISFFAKRYDPGTRQWFFDDFDKWFRNPGDSRAYVLLGDPGVGKSVLAGIMAHRMRKTGHLGAAYFCRHNDGTRNDPRYLLGTVARQLCDCNTQYKLIIGGEIGVKMLLGNSKLGVRELFTKLLQEPLSKCSPCDQRKLVIIDALDETEYESREDFLDLIMHRFPMLPGWLVFFITSRPEDSVQFTLKKYNPCVKICAENSDQDNFYQQHEQDIRTFLKNKIDFSRLCVTVEDISKKCNGLFLYAHYIVEELKLAADSGKELNQFSDLFPGDIDRFFLQNFKRVHDQVGQDIFKKLFGCAIVSPAPLPVSTISYILKKENSNHDEQQVIDAVSQFVVFRTSDQTLTFLHNLIPAWLTDKKKASRKLFIDKRVAGEYLINVFVEILQQANPATGPTSIDVDLKDYVSRVGVRFLCENGPNDSLKVVFDSLTNYHFIERRMKYGKIEIYHLLNDFRFASSHFAPEDVSKQKILQEILFAIKSDVLVLLECPHLVHSCIQNASNVVQESVSIPQVSTPWLEWISKYVFPVDVDANITRMHCFATAPNERIVAGAKGRLLQFFDASTVERVSGPFDLGSDAGDGVTHLEFTPDGKFLFFGRLDKWFSVERDCVEEFPQFSGNFRIYKWGVFTRDGQYIVVKSSFSSNPRNCRYKFCLAKLLALWALKEIEQSGDDEITVSFCPDTCNQEEPCNKTGLQIQSLFERLRMSQIYTEGLGEGLKRYDDASGSQGYSCRYCSKLSEITSANQEPSLENVRKLVIEFYPCIFHYEVWDRQSGLPLLQQVFSQNIQLNPFTYLCHCVYKEAGLKMKFSGIEKAMSLCNIAIVSAVCRFSVEFKCFLEEQCKPYLYEKMEIFWVLYQDQQTYEHWDSVEEHRKSNLTLLMEEHLKPYLRQLMAEHLKLYWHQSMKEHWEYYVGQLMEEKWESIAEHRKSYLNPLMEEHPTSYLNQLMEEHMKSYLHQLVEEHPKSYLHQPMEKRWKSYLGRLTEEQWESIKEQSYLHQLMEEHPKSYLHQPMGKHRKSYLSQLVEKRWKSGIKQNTKLQGFVSPELFRGVPDDAFKINLWRNIPKGFQNLLDCVNGEILTCVSPEMKWVIQYDDSLQVSKLQTGNQEERHIQIEKPVHTLSKLTRFTFSKDELFFVHPSSEGSLQALSLETGKVLSSVSGCNVCYLTRERQVGYLFRCGTEETAIFLTSLFSPFKFLPLSNVTASFVGKSMAAMFRSSNAVVSVSSDSMVTLMHNPTFADKEVIAEECIGRLTASSPQSPVKNCALSSDGKLIAIHKESKLELYCFTESKLKFLYSKCEFRVTCFAFSGDSTALVLCTQDSGNDSYFHVWDIQEEVVSARLESRGNLTPECCCLSLDKVVLCGDYEIEIWEYAAHTCCFITRFKVEKPYNCVRFSQCTLSVDDQFLVCCIADVILVYSLRTSNIDSSKQVFRGHLGRIESFRLLKINRYLISYGIDGVVFLWDISQSKAVGFIRIAERQESIVSMAVSPEEDRAVFFTSTGRVCMIKLCELGSALE